MRFSEFDNFKKIFGNTFLFSSEELDQWLDCIEDDPQLIQQIKNPKAQQLPFFRKYPLTQTLLVIARDKNLDLSSHTGTSLMYLSKAIQTIIKEGGRDEYICAGLKALLENEKASKEVMGVCPR